MKKIGTFGELRAIIDQLIVEDAMPIGMQFLDQMFCEYIEADSYSRSPKLACNQQDVQHLDDYQQFIAETSIPEEFWEYVRRRTEILLEFIDRSIDTPGLTEEFWDKIEEYNNRGGEQLLSFLENYVDGE